MLLAGPPREIKRPNLTDGFASDPRKGLCSVGCVIFPRFAARPVHFFEVVPQAVVNKWLPRVTQICTIELLAPVLLL